ncbi:MAG: hypothetical protein ACYCSF_02920 [Acidimicrobiales bacterium]
MIRRSDDGSIAAFSVLMCTALAALLGLVAEGGLVLATREAAMAEAEQAARAGAAVLSPGTLHAGDIINGGRGPADVAELVMATDGHPGNASAANGVVTATVSPFSVPTPLLILAGIASITVSARASAQAVAG